MPGWNFDGVRADAKKKWNECLSKIAVKTNDEDQRAIFYTAMYHAFLSPNLFTDVDGRYLGMDLLKELNLTTVNQLDAINYEDFQLLIKQRGSFKVAFEDIMFSTKVAIEKKEDFYDFVTKLIDNGFNNMAYNYLEGFQDYFFQDKEIVKLYKRLEEKQNETKHKQ
jgi:hypothetical protein